MRSPSRCYRCGSSTDRYRTCRSCRSSSPLFGVWSPSVYDGLAKDLVGKLKFGRGQEAASIIGSEIFAILPGHCDWIITHVPTANTRVRQRGYDQAQLIARHISRTAGCPYSALLARFGSSRQLGQTRQTRRKQMKQAFAPAHQNKIQNRHILLVDDVLTTGATLEAAATVLKGAGAKRVSAAVFAAA